MKSNLIGHVLVIEDGHEKYGMVMRMVVKGNIICHTWVTGDGNEW